MAFDSTGLDIIRGSFDNPLVEDLCDLVSTAGATGTLYIGYPVIAGPDEARFFDALLTSKEHGVVVLDLQSESIIQSGGQGWADQIKTLQDSLYTALHAKLLNYTPLVENRSLRFAIQVVSVVSDLPKMRLKELTNGAVVVDLKGLKRKLSTFVSINAPLLQEINAAIQRVATIKPANKRAYVRRDKSRGAILRDIERQIANLDSWQKKGAIEYVDGPQRLRGLAGSGKTIVLALKAAYLHARHPDWRIVVTFHTRSLYQQFRDLIRRFYYETANDEPDWDQLTVMHSWGGRDQLGVCSEIATAHNVPSINFGEARQKFGDPMKGMCQSLLDAIRGKPQPLYDMILVDEAQDLPQEFFELIYLVVKKPKRIVYAYDELQNLVGNAMPTAEALFGKDPAGKPLVRLKNAKGKAQEDIILPICYRNTPWALTIAHGLGFGTARPEGLVQFFDQPALWTQIGYEVVQGALQPNSEVVLKRKSENAPEFFARLLKPEDAVSFSAFASEDDQASWIAHSIVQNLKADELRHEDILVIIADPLLSRSRFPLLRRALDEHGILSHLAGVTAGRDHLFIRDSIAITGIFRAKGNEAPMVYIWGAEYAFSAPQPELARRRNVLFTAITRSRAWVRVCGVGSGMDGLISEADRIRQSDFQLNFTYPTAAELARLRTISSDWRGDEDAENRILGAQLRDLARTGRLDLDALPPELKNLLFPKRK